MDQPLTGLATGGMQRRLHQSAIRAHSGGPGCRTTDSSLGTVAANLGPANVDVAAAQLDLVERGCAARQLIRAQLHKPKATCAGTGLSQEPTPHLADPPRPPEFMHAREFAHAYDETRMMALSFDTAEESAWQQHNGQ